MGIPQRNLDMLDDATATNAKSLVEDLGKLDASHRRANQLEKLAAWTFTRLTELQIKVGVSVAIGSLLGNTFALQSAKLGPWAPIASYAGGIALNLGLDHLATNNFSLLHRQRNLNSALASIDRLQSKDKRNSDFINAYYDAQRLWVEEVEGNTDSPNTIYIVLLGVGLLIEFFASLFLSQTLDASSDSLNKIIAAALPPLLVLLAATVQSGIIDQSKDAASAIGQYRKMSDELSGDKGQEKKISYSYEEEDDEP
ncbi:MAG: hypothetical protein KME26_18240 [Oscillatoria princeps RMCB-10]|nr:hypothetical protein [Oscillatoria princeps RMCB-10]